VPTRAAQVARPCFVTSPDRIVLPAFGAYTGGLDVRHPEIAGLFPRGGRVFLLGKDRLYSFAIAPTAKSASIVASAP
jgi:metallophosphoesterase superfamily enzyme